MQVVITTRLLDAFQEIVRKNDFSWCKFCLLYFSADGKVGKRNTKSTVFDPWDCDTSVDQEEWEGREICPSNRDGCLS